MRRPRRGFHEDKTQESFHRLPNQIQDEIADRFLFLVNERVHKHIVKCKDASPCPCAPEEF